MIDESPSRSRRVPAIVACAGLVACALAGLHGSGWNWLSRPALIQAPLLTTMGIAGMIDPRLFHAPFPGREGIPLWARVIGCTLFAAAAIATIFLLAVRYGPFVADG